MDSIPITFKEIIPDHNAAEKWREIVLNTGGTHSTLQDIKLPLRAGGYCYKESKKAITRNRFIYWQTTSDSIELSEASLDSNLSGAHLRCKVAAGTPPLDVTVWERTRDVVVLVATVSSVHRLVFPHPELEDKKGTFGSAHGSALSIFHDATPAAANNVSNYYILPQYSNTNASVAHSCASWLRPNGEAIWALVWGRSGGGDTSGGGLLVVKLPSPGAGMPLVMHLKRESTVPRFLSGITGALRGKSSSESAEMCSAVVAHDVVVAVCADACLRVWSASDGGPPLAVSRPLTLNPARPPTHSQGHKLQKSIAPDGNLVVVAFLSFPSECEFVVTKVQRDATGNVKFTNICRLYGPELELVEYRVGAGEERAIWALWSQPDGDNLITTSSLGAEAEWRAVAPRDPPAQLAVLPSHQHYRDKLFAPGLFPIAVIKKALVIYRRTWGGGGGGMEAASSGAEGDVREAASAAVQARLRHLAARPHADHSQLMHRCWSDLYSWCVQYMEGLQKPLGLIVSKHEESGWWCGVVRRGGVSFVRALSPLERLLLAPDMQHSANTGGEEVSVEARAVLTAGARWERWLGAGGADDIERRLFSCAAPQHRLLPRLLHLLATPPDDTDATLTPQNIDELSAMLDPIQDLQKAVLELNEVLRLDVPELDLSTGQVGDVRLECLCTEEAEDDGEYEMLFSSDLGVSVLTEAIRQMAELRGRMVRGVVGALVTACGADGVPGAGHCIVHWQAYRALLWLRSATLHTHQPGASDELFRLKLSVLSVECEAGGGAGGGAVCGYAAGAGGARARRYLAAARAPTVWHAALPLMSHHLAYQMWAVSGRFEFGWWLATINQPKLVQSYVALLEPWCEWNSCSRQFILGMSLLDTGDMEGAYIAFCKAAKGATSEPFLRHLIQGPSPPATQNRALVLYYLKVIKLFEIHDAGAYVVRLAETAISIADRDDPNLAMFQWLVFKWHLASGPVERALTAAVANPAPHARANAAATLLTTLASRKQLDALVKCAELSTEAEKAAATRAKLHEANGHNPYYSFLYALHVSRSHYRKAGMVMYERASRCASEDGGWRWRRRCLVAALTCLRLVRPEHAFLTCPAPDGAGGHTLTVLGADDLAKQLRELDAQHPSTRHNVKTLLPEGDKIDFEELRQNLKDASAEAIHIVAKRLLSSGQFLPHWLLKQYMSVDCGGCVRTLLGTGRAVEAAAAVAESVRETLRSGMTVSHAGVACSALAPLDLVRAELQAHLHDPLCRQAYDELEQVVEEYMKVVSRTSRDIQLAQIKYPVQS